MNKKSLFAAEYFTILKGLAIIFMVAHHAFGFPEWYVDGILYPDIEPYSHLIASIFRICIPMFVFFTGGGIGLRLIIH